ncbi:MAG TPA: acyltransferase [Sedimentisphaerales bacterium]|nr:acyltransferase [Sedimentisphaerales bacterium]
MLRNPRSISIGKKVLIRKGARLEAVGEPDGERPKITIGDGTAIQFYFHCGAAESVTIGKNVLISGRVYITDHDHVFDDPELPARNCSKLKSAPVVIEDGVWLGEGCVILKGVTVSERAVVGANAVVTKDVPPFTVVGGVPARVIRKIDRCFSQER